MKRYKNDIEKIKASDEIKQQTILMMQKNLHSKKISYKRNFQLALSASFVLFICTAVLSATLIGQRSDKQDIPLDSQDQMMRFESDETSEDIIFEAQIMETPELEAKVAENFEDENCYYDEDRIICGAITLMDDAFIEVDGKKVYTENFTHYKNEIVVGNNVEVLVFYIDNEPYAEWIELAGN